MYGEEATSKEIKQPPMMCHFQTDQDIKKDTGKMDFRLQEWRRRIEALYLARKDKDVRDHFL